MNTPPIPPTTSTTPPHQVTHITQTDGQLIAAGKGDTYRLTITSAMTQAAGLIMHATIEPHGGPPLHKHQNEDEWFYITSGEIAFFNGTEAVTAQQGDFIFAPRGSTHTFKNRTNTPATMLIGIYPGKGEQFFKDFGTLNPDGSHPTDEEIKQRIIALAPQYGLEILGPNPL